MIRPVKSMCGLLVCASDGPLGTLTDVHFHDTLWLVRSLVVNCHAPARRVVIPIASAGTCRFDPSGIRLGVALHELNLLPRMGDGSVRSARSLAGYSIQASDGAAGRVADLVVDDGGWWIPRLVVDTRSLLPGSKHEVPSKAVAAIDSLHRRVHLRITRAQIAALPAPVDSARLALL